MPIGFWNDPDDKKFRAAYFEHYQDHVVWHHGDFVEITESGGVVVYGRSDSTLNPGGVRIGTAEIYRQVEHLEAVYDSLAVGRPIAGDVEIILFVKLAENQALNEELVSLIKGTIRKNLTPRHVPARVIDVKDIPYTRSGKKVEVAVIRALSGDRIENLGALANPECMDEYIQLGESL